MRTVTMTMMKTATATVLAICGLSANAVPDLQLDIEGGFYVGGTEESVVTTDDIFTLNAILTEGQATIDQTYYLSVALIPGVTETTPSPDLGSIVIDGTTFDLTADMVYGTPPIDVSLSSKDLPSHDIYPTYYLELDFTFDPSMQTATYNVQDNPDGLDTSGTGSFYQSFDFDISGLAADYELHFDLYNTALNKKGDTVIGQFAPFSHDARTIPEPSVLALMGLGLLGVAFSLRKH